LFFWFFITGGAIGPVVAAVSKELFPISISGTSVGVVNLFPFAGATFFQILIGAVLTARSQDQGNYATAGYQIMFLICLAGAVVSLAAALLMRETFVKSDIIAEVGQK
jgi:MFS family permease